MPRGSRSLYVASPALEAKYRAIGLLD